MAPWWPPHSEVTAILNTVLPSMNFKIFFYIFFTHAFLFFYVLKLHINDIKLLNKPHFIETILNISDAKGILGTLLYFSDLHNATYWFKGLYGSSKPVMFSEIEALQSRVKGRISNYNVFLHFSIGAKSLYFMNYQLGCVYKPKKIDWNVCVLINNCIY